MGLLLKLSNGIDRVNALIGRHVIWLVFLAILVSAINAFTRKVLGISSNAYLELQWYLYAGSFLLAAGLTLLENEHVKIDIVYSHFSRRMQLWIEIFGYALFLLPTCLIVLYFGVPFFIRAYVSGEVSSSAGGLVRWPVYLLLPLGFGLLMLQGCSELIKRAALLKNRIPNNSKHAE